MNTAVKILIVFVTACSLSFMALAGAVSLGGPNWWGRTQDLKEFTFEASVGETTTYSAAYRPTGESVKSGSESLADVVVAALNKESQVLTAKEQELDQKITAEQGNIQALKSYQAKDVAAMDARAAEFATELKRINDQINQTINNSATQEADSVTEKLQAMTAQGELLKKRREDVLRLRDQLALVRTDHDRLAEQKQELGDILVLLEASIAQLERRAQQLQDRSE
ncbi:MAG: hypothetical protein P8M30_05810 [Planctomycetaceae bacterium]|jgi:hypothetical protein|nr:hypothetical protein [Planctomycetaceae bacterium]